MSIFGTLIRPSLVIVALVAGTNAAAYWSAYTMDRLEPAAESALLSLPRWLEADTTRTAADGDHRGLPESPQAEEFDGHEDTWLYGADDPSGLTGDVPVDPGVGCISDTW